MSYKSINIIFFDINNIIDEEIDNEQEEKKIQQNENKENNIVKKAIKHFINNHILIDKETDEVDSYFECNFIYQIEENITQKCIFYSLSKVNVETFSLDVNGIFIFCDLDNEKNIELFQKVIENIKKKCPHEIKIFILGIKSKKEATQNKEIILSLFNEEEITFKYNEIDVNINENNDNNNENKDNELNKRDEEMYTNIDKYIEDAMNDIFKDINFRKPSFINNNNSFNEEDSRAVSCSIF